MSYQINIVKPNGEGETVTNDEGYILLLPSARGITGKVDINWKALTPLLTKLILEKMSHQ